VPIFKRCKYFYLPNIGNGYRKRFLYKSTPLVNQRLVFTGNGKVEIGNNCSFGFKMGGFHYGGSIEFQPRTSNAIIRLGNNIATNNNLFICSASYIEIGDDCLIGQNVTIMDFEVHGSHPRKRREMGEIGNVKIGKNVWIGNNVVIIKNTEIGDNCIVASGAVVRGVFRSNVLIGGVPAKEIKSIN
jgi:acetyltransferase-like isoleucine patch superfamily enzyme